MWITCVKTQYIVLAYEKNTIYCIMTDIICVEKMWTTKKVIHILSTLFFAIVLTFRLVGRFFPVQFRVIFTGVVMFFW